MTNFLQIIRNIDNGNMSTPEFTFFAVAIVIFVVSGIIYSKVTNTKKA